MDAATDVVMDNINLEGFTAHSYHVCQAAGECAILTNKRVSVDGFPKWFLCDMHRHEFEVERLLERQRDIDGHE